MPDPQTPPTLDDVARRAGVSTATVSRCVNDPKVVRAPTRERVEAAIRDLGYTPNFAARVMAAKRTFTIGAIIPTMENAIFARGLQAFQEELHRRGYTLLVSSSAYRAEAEAEQIRTLVARGADGLLLIGHDRDPDLLDYLDRQRVPALVAWSHDDTARAPSIGFDNRAAMHALADRVIALGHRDIAMISGISHHNDRARMRIAGVRDAMAAGGLDPQSLRLAEVPYGIEDGAGAFRDLMARRPTPSAVLCGNDVLAAGALRGAAKLGLEVPEQVSITGFDDIELARLVTPGLSTVHVPHREMGRLAAQELVAMIEEQRPGVSQCLTTAVKHRASLGPVPVRHPDTR